MGLFDHFPYTNFHELNLMWILEALKEIQTTTEQFVAINSLKYADPIQWNIVSQYEKNTIVIDPLTGVAYISVQPVPSGVSLTNTDYWTVVFDLGSFVTRAAKNFTDRWEEDTTLTATFPTAAGEWLVWGDTLYKALVNITAGDSYVVDSNIKRITIEEVKDDIYSYIDTLTGDLDDLNTTDKSNLVAAINELLLTLITTAGDLNDLDTTDKSNLVAAINEVYGIITDVKTQIDNTKIVNVIDFGAVGDGIEDDTIAISDAIATGNIVYFPAGTYLISSISGLDNSKFIGAGILYYNSHNIPVDKADSVSLYDSDFGSLSDLISWANNITCNTLSIYAAADIALFTMSNLKHAASIKVHLYPTGNVTRIVADIGNLHIHSITWADTTAVAHILIMNHAYVKISGSETVKAAAANFHYWVIDSTLDISGLSVEVDSNCAFQFFLYAERNSFVNADQFTWTGTTGTCWGASIIENSYCEAQVANYAAYNTYFPSSHSNSPNVNSRDYLLSALAVGGRIGNIPDYGWKPFYGTTGYDLAGKTLMQADDIPDQYTMLTVYAKNVVLPGGVLYVQIRRMFENTWDTTTGDYTGRDQQVTVNPLTKTVSGGVVNVGGVDYPVTGATVSVNSETFKLEDFSVSAISFGTGNNTIELQLTFIQYQGLTRPMYIGYVKDGAGTKHYIIGLCKEGRIASIRLLASQAITSGTGNIILTY